MESFVLERHEKHATDFPRKLFLSRSKGGVQANKTGTHSVTERADLLKIRPVFIILWYLGMRLRMGNMRVKFIPLSGT